MKWKLVLNLLKKLLLVAARNEMLGRGQPWHPHALYNLEEEPASPSGWQRPVGSGIRTRYCSSPGTARAGGELGELLSEV